MKIPGAHLQIFGNQFSEKSMHPFLRTCVDKIMSTDWEQSEGQTDKWTDRVNQYTPKLR